MKVAVVGQGYVGLPLAIAAAQAGHDVVGIDTNIELVESLSRGKSPTGDLSDEQISKLVSEHFDLRPKGIVKMLDLLRPIYQKTAAYGHFGREEPQFTWEARDRVIALKSAAGL